MQQSKANRRQRLFKSGRSKLVSISSTMPGRADERPSLRSPTLVKLQRSISGADVAGARAQRTSGRFQSFDPAISIQSKQSKQFDAFRCLTSANASNLWMSSILKCVDQLILICFFFGSRAQTRCGPSMNTSAKCTAKLFLPALWIPVLGSELRANYCQLVH